MKRMIFFLLCVACSHQTPTVVERPAWVEAVRSGDEGLRVLHGNKIYFRRIAGSKELSKEKSCELAVIKAEEDIKKEYPLFPRVPFNVEVLVYDREHQDCAVTASIDSQLEKRYEEIKLEYQSAVLRKEELAGKEHVTEDEVTELLQLRAETATRYAQVGLTKDEFERFTKDKVYLSEAAGECQRVFRAPASSTHGTTQVCWSGEHVVGYCTSVDNTCWKKTP
jgi:hypothetical protein